MRLFFYPWLKIQAGSIVPSGNLPAEMQSAISCVLVMVEFRFVVID